MMKILDRLPIATEDSVTLVGSDRIRLKKHQIIVRVSLTVKMQERWHPTVAHFPVIVDTGHTHNFAIQARHLIAWANLRPEMLRQIGHIRHDAKRLSLHAVNLWLHRNQPGSMAASEEEPIYLEMQNGIAVYPDEDNYPRLPILGLRTILSIKLHLAIDGEHASLTMRTPDWRTRIDAWLP